jgi:hypothetical protein
MKQLLLLLVVGTQLSAGCHRLFLGPDVPIHMDRTRASGSRQHGYLYGAEGGYERSKRFGFYWGARGYYAKGNLHGRDPRGNKIESRQTEGELEGRFGYTLGWRCFLEPSITPFIAYGYLRDINDFAPPSPMAICSRCSFQYPAVGFLSSISCAGVSIGFMGKLIYLTSGKCRVSEDPKYDDVTIQVNDELSYRLELPVSYAFCNWHHSFRMSAVPFWWYRHYGGREGWPFDYVDTRIQIWGLRLMLSTFF